MPGMVNLFNAYRGSIKQAIENGAWYIELDKPHMKETWDDLYHGLIFYHNIFASLATELRMKFYIYTSERNSNKFSVVFEKEDGKDPDPDG